MEMSNISDLKIALWLRDRCGVDESKAVTLAKRLDTQNMITDVIALKELVLRVPNALSLLKIPIGLQTILSKKLSVCENKDLGALTIREVYLVVQNVLPLRRDYARAFRKNRVNSFVLSSVKRARQLVRIGIETEEDAEKLYNLLIGWRVSGVPKEFLIDRGIDEQEDDEARMDQVSSDGTTQQEVIEEGNGNGRRRHFEKDVGDDEQTHTTKKRKGTNAAELPAEPEPEVEQPHQVSMRWLRDVEKQLQNPRDITTAMSVLEDVLAAAKAGALPLEEAALSGLMQSVIGATAEFANPDESVAPKATRKGAGRNTHDGEVVKLGLIIAETVVLAVDAPLRKVMLRDRGVLNFFLKQACGPTHQLRLAAVDVLHRLAATDSNELLLSLQTTALVKKAYFVCVATGSGKEVDEVRSHFITLVDAICRLAREPPRLDASAVLLPFFLAILRNILSYDGNGRTNFPRACQVTRQLLQAAPEALPRAIKDWEIAYTLAGRLNDSNRGVVHSALQCLTEICALVREEDGGIMHGVLVQVEQLLTTSPSAQQAAAIAQYLQAYLKLGTSALAHLLKEHAAIVSALMQQLDDESYEGAAAVKEAAATILQAAEAADEDGLSDLLQHGLYAALFRMLSVLLATEEENAPVLVRALECLHKLVLGVENIEASALCREGQAARWGRVSKLAHATNVGTLGDGGGVPRAVSAAAKRLMVVRAVAVGK